MARNPKLTLPVLTRDYFLEYDKQANRKGPRVTPKDAETATTDTVFVGGSNYDARDNACNTDGAFEKASDQLGSLLRRRAKENRARWGCQLAPMISISTTFARVRWVIAFSWRPSVRWWRHRPYEVSDILKPKCNGGFIVTLPEVDPFELHPLTQAELVLSSTCSGEGVWLAALEQAYGKYREKQKGSPDPEGTDIIASGGQPGAAMSLLTGHKYKRVFFATTAKRREQDQAKMLPILRKSLVDAIKDDRLITATVTPPILAADDQSGHQPDD